MFLPADRSLESLRQAAEICKGCALYKEATQTVFGKGPGQAELVMIGEQPGDAEDRQGEPFVGPAGRLLDRALVDAKIARDQVYVTNAVKHFKWIWRGKRRLHQKPSIRQISACKPWLEAEIDAIDPKLLVCMGVTASQTVLGKTVSVTRERGKFAPSVLAKPAFITIHPSAILRLRESEEQDQEYRRFVADLQLVRRKLESLAGI